MIPQFIRQTEAVFIVTAIIGDIFPQDEIKSVPIPFDGDRNDLSPTGNRQVYSTGIEMPYECIGAEILGALRKKSRLLRF